MATVNDHLYKWVQYEADRPETLLVVCSCRSSYLPGICARDGGVSEPQNPFHSYGVSGESSQSPSIQKRKTRNEGKESARVRRVKRKVSSKMLGRLFIKDQSSLDYAEARRQRHLLQLLQGRVHDWVLVGIRRVSGTDEADMMPNVEPKSLPCAYGKAVLAM